jgi:hypothetical protein
MAKVNIQIHIKMCIKNAIIAIAASVGNTERITYRKV